MPADISTAERRGRLPRLLADVAAARQDEEDQAHLRPHATGGIGLVSAQQTTLRALLVYAAAIDALSWPVPREIQMDIRMHRILCGSAIGRHSMS